MPPAILSPVLRLAGQYGLVLLIGVLVMAWGTSPCLYAELVRGAIAHGEDCCCDCCCDPSDGPTSGTDDCPACSAHGNMHEIPPVGEPIVLAPPVDAFLDVPAVQARIETEAPVTMIDTDAGRTPPRVAFRETVRLTR